MNTGCVFIEKWVKLVILGVGQKMGKTSKGQGSPEKWDKRVRAGGYPKNGRKTTKMKIASDLPENVIKSIRGAFS